jgi:putative membrane protein insertion efficiency factor
MSTNPIPKITLDTNCVVNLIDFSSQTPTSVDALSELVRYGLSQKIDIAITTRVETDLDNDKDLSLWGSRCVFYPSCSEYGHEAIHKYGIIHGTTILIKRIFRCRPGTPFTIDFLK